MRRAIQTAAAVFALAMTVAGWSFRDAAQTTRADEPETDPASQEAKQRKERYSQWMREYADATAIRIHPPGEKRDQEGEVPELVPHPVVRYSSKDYAADATLWIWTQEARPVALQKIEVNNSGGGQNWTICFASVADGLVTAEWPHERRFAATEPGVTFRAIPDADPPAETAKKRTAQIRALKDRFSGRMTFPDPEMKPNELNPIAKALFEYTDPATGLPRGAIFSMVGPKTDRNPGFLLFIEARADRQGNPRWEYAGARMGTAGVLLRLDNQEAWSLPIVQDSKNVFDNWTYFVIPRSFK